MIIRRCYRGKESRFSIGEISKLTGVTVRTLQYYDNINLVPLEKDEENGRRYFKESDLTRLQQVLFYKSLGLKIKDISKLLEETTTAKQLINVLEKQRRYSTISCMISKVILL